MNSFTRNASDNDQNASLPEAGASNSRARLPLDYTASNNFLANAETSHDGTSSPDQDLTWPSTSEDEEQDEDAEDAEDGDSPQRDLVNGRLTPDTNNSLVEALGDSHSQPVSDNSWSTPASPTYDQIQDSLQDYFHYTGDSWATRRNSRNPRAIDHIDLTSDNPSAQRTMSHNLRNRHFPPQIINIKDESDEEEPVTRPSKRARISKTQSQAITSLDPQLTSSRSQNQNQNQPTTIEQIDFSSSDSPDRALAATLQKQRAEQVASQSTSSATNKENVSSTSSKSKITNLTCTVCLEPPTDLTATACGHLFCRNCLMDWLVSAEKDPLRRPNCPACRKSIGRTSKRGPNVIPLVFKKTVK